MEIDDRVGNHHGSVAALGVQANVPSYRPVVTIPTAMDVYRLYRSGNYKCIRTCDILLADDPANMEAYHFKAMSYYYTGDMQQAYNTLVCQLILNPKNELALYNTACAAAKLDRPARAVGLLERLLALDMTYKSKISADSDFDSIVESEDYQKLMGVSVIAGSELLRFDAPPLVENDRVLIPVRRVFESLGAAVDWDESTKAVTAHKDRLSLRLTVDSTAAMVNGEERELDVPARVVNDCTLVPVRFAAEALGAQVDWDENNQAVSILTPAPLVVSDRTLVPVRAVAESFDAEVSWDGDAQAVLITQPSSTPDANVTLAPAESPVPPIDASQTREVFYTSIKLPNDETVYPLLMRDIALIGEDETCYNAQTTLCRVLTMARHGYRIVDIGDNHPSFSGYHKVIDIPLGIKGFNTPGARRTGTLYDEADPAKKYHFSSEGKGGYAPAIWYNSSSYLKITDVLDFFEVPYRSVTYDESADNIVIELAQSPDLHQMSE